MLKRALLFVWDAGPFITILGTAWLLYECSQGRQAWGLELWFFVVYSLSLAAWAAVRMLVLDTARRNGEHGCED